MLQVHPKLGQVGVPSVELEVEAVGRAGRRAAIGSLADLGWIVALQPGTTASKGEKGEKGIVYAT